MCASIVVFIAIVLLLETAETCAAKAACGMDVVGRSPALWVLGIVTRSPQKAQDITGMLLGRKEMAGKASEAGASLDTISSER